MIRDRRRKVWIAVGGLACVGLGILAGSLYTSESLAIWAALAAIQGLMIFCLGGIIAYDSGHYTTEIDEMRRRNSAAADHEMSPRIAQLEREFLIPQHRLH